MSESLTQTFTEITVLARVVYTGPFKLAVTHPADEGRVREHIRAEAEADESRNGFCGTISIIYTDEAKGIVRGNVPKKFEGELSNMIGCQLRAVVTICNFGSRILQSFEVFQPT